MKASKEVIAAYTEIGVQKCTLPVWKLFLAGMFGGVFIALGYLGCLVIGLPCGAKFVKELRHAGIIREV